MKDIRSKKDLAIVISKLEDFEKCDVSLEQYSTPSEIAADLVWNAAIKGEIEGKVILDAAAGPGFLGLGALLLGAKKVFFVDISKEAIGIAKRNYETLNSYYELGEAIFIVENIEDFDEEVDTVVQNPPFGTKEKHADKMFLEKVFKLSKSIFTIHKITSEDFIKAITKDYGFNIIEIKEIDFMLRQTQKFHKKKRHYIKCGMWHLKKP